MPIYIDENGKRVNPYDPTPKTERNEKIVKLHQEGIKQAEIARLYNLSRNAVSKIIKREVNR